MIDSAHDLSVTRQAKALNISRGSVYYKPRELSLETLALMRRIDELHLEHPFAGARMLRDFLNREGIDIGRRRVATMMKRMGVEAIYRKPNTSKPAPAIRLDSSASTSAASSTTLPRAALMRKAVGFIMASSRALIR